VLKRKNITSAGKGGRPKFHFPPNRREERKEEEGTRIPDGYFDREIAKTNQERKKRKGRGLYFFLLNISAGDRWGGEASLFPPARTRGGLSGKGKKGRGTGSPPPPDRERPRRGMAGSVMPRSREGERGKKLCDTSSGFQRRKRKKRIPQLFPYLAPNLRRGNVPRKRKGLPSLS